MALGGETAKAGAIPSERIATDVRTSASSSFTAETTVQSVTASLVSGRTYRVRYSGTLQSTVADGTCRSRIREDNSTGTQMQLLRMMTSGAANAGFDASVEAEYTAAATASKTFVVTGERATGTGNITSSPAATQAAYLYVDYIRG